MSGFGTPRGDLCVFCALALRSSRSVRGTLPRRSITASAAFSTSTSRRSSRWNGPEDEGLKRFVRRKGGTTELPTLDAQQSRLYHRPTTAPKPHVDVKHIAQNPGLYEQNSIDRKYANLAKNSWRILELRQRKNDVSKEAVDYRQRNTRLGDDIKSLSAKLRGQPSGDPGKALAKLKNDAKTLKDKLSTYASQEKELEAEIQELALGLPNLTSNTTPLGFIPSLQNTVVPSNIRLTNQACRSHVDIGRDLGILDFASSARTAGWGWYYLKGRGEELENALIQYTRTVLTKSGWTSVSVPSIAYSHIAAACGFQPRDQNGESQIYHLAQGSEKTLTTEGGPEDGESEKPDRVLTATAEIPLAAMYAQTTLSEADLPIRAFATSRCYRAEAGARGVDTKGLYRVHEFTKVEMFAWTKAPREGEGFDTNPEEQQIPEQAPENILNSMVDIQSQILSDLGLPHRILEMPTHDLGASASRKLDIEVLFPSRRRHSSASPLSPSTIESIMTQPPSEDDSELGWGEVTSASDCTDYQTRRLSTRVKDKSGVLTYPYTLNGTALAVPRVLAAVLEWGWDEENGVVNLPEVLNMSPIDVSSGNRLPTGAS